jgi:hypothetical protein
MVKLCLSLIGTRSHVAAKEHAAVYPHTFNAAYRGTAGPIQVSIPHHLHTLDLLLRQSFENKGLKSVPDPYGGDVSFSRRQSYILDQSK